MATTFVEYTGDGNATKQFTFPSLQESDVKVRVDGVLKTTSTHYNITSYTTTGGGNVVFTSGNIPSSPANIRIYRDTNVDVAKATYTAGSSVKAADLNNNNTQLLYRSQEEQIPNLIHSYDIDASAIETSNVKDSAVTTAKIAADAVTNAKIADDQIDSEHYVDQSIDTQHIANLNITTAKIANSNVTTAKIADLNVTRAKLEADAVDGTKIADNSINSEHYVDGSIDTAHLDTNVVTAPKLADSAVTSSKLATNAVLADKIAAGQITSDKLNAATVITAAEQGSATTNDTSFLTSAAADARFFNISTGDTIKDGDTFPDNDTTIATTAAINDRIIDLVDDVGGFVPIANETSFPTANPDVNNGSGTLVSIKGIASTRTPSTGTVTIANGAGTGNTVTITGCGSTVLAAGFGVIVETTSTLHTYAFHRLVPKATEVTTVSGISSNVTTVAGIQANVTSVANIDSDVTTVAGIASDVTAVAANNTNITAVKNNETNINAVKNNQTNINTVATANTAVNTVATNIASVNNASANINSVNNFGDTYQVHSSNPTTDGGGNTLAEGDLYFNTSANRLKVYDGANWVDGVVASGGGAQTTGDTFTGDVKLNDNVNLLVGTHEDLKIVHNGNDSIINDHGTGTLKIQSSGNTKIEVTGSGAAVTGNLDVSSGVDVTGNITVSGNVDGRDVAADGNKLDGISSGAIANVVQDTTPQLGGELDTNGHEIKLDNLKKIKFGDDNDMQIYHHPTGDRNVINSNKKFEIYANGDLELKQNTGELYFKGVHSSGAAELLHDNSKKFETTSTGIDVTGNITVSGTVDGRDVASDGSKLDGIESGSTGDQTAAEILTAIKTVDGAGSGLDADFLDGENSSSYLRSNANATFSEVLTLSKDVINGLNFSASSTNDRRGISFNGRTAVSADHNDGYLRLNDAQGFTNGVFTPGVLRVDGGINWNGTQTIVNNSGQLNAARLTGALPAIDGSSLTGINTDLVSDTSPQLGGNLDSNGRNITLGDSGSSNDDRLQLGAGSNGDLEIYHDGNHNYIDSKNGNFYLRETGSGYIIMSTNHFHLDSDAGEAIIHADANGSVELMFNDGKKFETSNTGVTITGNCNPDANNTRDLGTSSLRWANLYTNDLHLSNEGSSNDVDGSWGDWTIQEGESDLFLKNNRSGKKYKFNLTEVS